MLTCIGPFFSILIKRTLESPVDLLALSQCLLGIQLGLVVSFGVLQSHY